MLLWDVGSSLWFPVVHCSIPSEHQVEAIGNIPADSAVPVLGMRTEDLHIIVRKEVSMRFRSGPKQLMYSVLRRHIRHCLVIHYGIALYTRL